MALTLLLAGFVLASAAVWFAGIRLSNATDVLSMRKLGDYQLAVSGIFGGNAFLPVLFLPTTQ